MKACYHKSETSRFLSDYKIHTGVTFYQIITRIGTFSIFLSFFLTFFLSRDFDFSLRGKKFFESLYWPISLILFIHVSCQSNSDNCRNIWINVENVNILNIWINSRERSSLCNCIITTWPLAHRNILYRTYLSYRKVNFFLAKEQDNWNIGLRPITLHLRYS